MIPSRFREFGAVYHGYETNLVYVAKSCLERKIGIEIRERFLGDRRSLKPA
jgi:hypothetical protein